MKTLPTLLTIVTLGFVAFAGDVAGVNTTTEETGATITCANVRCQSGTQCVLQQVQCIRAPCPAQPVCLPVDTPTQSTNACSPGFCSDGETCELKQVQCFAAPCAPVPTCVPQKTTTLTCSSKKCGRSQRCFLYNNEPHCADVCSASRCAKSERCVLQEVQCLVAPCPRVAACRPL